MSKVTYQKGRTINLGNYENIKIDIGVELDYEEGKLDEAYLEAKTFVEDRLSEELGTKKK